MSCKERDKQEIQAAKDAFRALVADTSLDAALKWTEIHQEIRRLRKEAAAVLMDESCGVVTRDRRAKLAAFACEYATGFYEMQLRDTSLSAEEIDELELKLGDLARHLAGIKSVPRAAPELTPKEAALRDHWATAAIGHYDALRKPLRVYSDRIRRLAEEVHEPDVLLPLLFVMRKAINDTHSMMREKTLALDAELRQLPQGEEGIYSDFVRFAQHTLQAAASGSSLFMTQSTYTRWLKLWNQPAQGCTREQLITIIVALTLVAAHTKTLVVNAKHMYQQLLRSQRLHEVFVDAFVEGNLRLEAAPLLRRFLKTTILEGRPLDEKVRLLNSYPARF